MSEEKIPFEDELLAEKDSEEESSIKGNLETADQESEIKIDNQNDGDSSLEPSPEEEITSLRDKLIRQVAETENLRKRSEREREDTARYAVTKFARDMLEILDNLDRALQACEGQEESLGSAGNTLLEGVTLTHKTLLSAFDRHHIKKITPKGEKFDHNAHQAMFEIESNEHDPGTIMEVVQPGYLLHDRLLRPAMVGVSKKKTTPSE